MISEKTSESHSDIGDDSFSSPPVPPKLGAVCDELKYANFNAKQLDSVTKYFNKLKQVHKVQISNVKVQATNIANDFLLKKSKEFNLVFSKEQQFLLGQFIEYRDRISVRLKKLEGIESKMND